MGSLALIRSYLEVVRQLTYYCDLTGWWYPMGHPYSHTYQEGHQGMNSLKLRIGQFGNIAHANSCAPALLRVFLK